MKLVSLTLRDWRSFERLELEFPDGVIGVRGANGAGKTTIAEAIGWTLFGKLRPGAKLGELRRQDAPERAKARAELVFRLSDTLYRVERVAGGGAKLFIGDGAEPETTQTRATNARLIQALDMTWETYQRTVYARQKDVAALAPSATAEQRKRHVERLLGLERFRLAAEKARAQAGTLDAELRGLREHAPDVAALQQELADATAQAAGNDPEVQAAQSDADALSASIEALEAAVEGEVGRAALHHQRTQERDRLVRELAQDTEDLDGKRQRLQTYDEQVRRLGELDANQVDLDALQRLRTDWDELQRCGQELEAALEALEADPFDADAARARAEAHAVLRGELDDLLAAPTPDLAPLEARVAALAAADGLPSAAAARAALDQLEAARDTAKADHAAARRSITRDEQHLAEIEQSGESAECPICLREYGPTLPTIVTRHHDTLAALRGTADRLAGDCERLDTEHGAARAVLGQAEDAERRLAESNGADDLSSARTALAAARAAAEQHATRLRELRAAVPELAAQVQADMAQARAHDSTAAVVTEHRKREAHAAARLGVDVYAAAPHAAAVTAADTAATEERERGQLRAAIDAAQALPGEVATLTARLAEQKAGKHAVEQELETLAFDAARLPALRAELQQARADRDNAAQALLDAKVRAAQRDEAVQDLATRLEEAKETQRAIAERERTLREHKAAGDLLSEYRSHQNLRAWPQLEQGASALLNEATEGRYADVRLSEDYRLEIYDRGEPFGIERFSGGEQDLANLCLRLAIADWVARERNVEVGFVILDEVFGSQDEDRRRGLMTELRSLGARFHQLLVITHVPEIAEQCEHQLEVTRNGSGPSAAAFR